MSDFLTAALYKFVDLPDFEAMQGPLQAFCDAHQVKGTLLLAREGINGTIAGAPDDVRAVLAYLRSDPRLAVLEHKGRIEHVFLASKFRGTLQLGGPELARMSEDNQYHLLWLDYHQLQQVKLRPKNLLVHCQEWLWPQDE